MIDVPYVIGNWKMRLSFEDSVSLARLLTTLPAGGGTVVICPAFPYLSTISEIIHSNPILLGAQDVSPDENGPYTGEVSAAMLRTVGCRFVIVGHSDRRLRQKETDEVIARKAEAALRYDLTPIVCIGETREERMAGQSAVVLKRQLSTLVNLIPDAVNRLIIAYEPVWAISHNPAARGEEAASALPIIAASLSSFSPPVIYGGSVNASNVTDFVGQKQFQGVLVGAESLQATEFIGIVSAARQAFSS